MKLMKVVVLFMVFTIVPLFLLGGSCESTPSYTWGIDSILSFWYDRERLTFYPDIGGTTSVTIDKYGDVGDTIEGISFATLWL